MPLYAHALIEVGDDKYPRGSEVPDDLEGLDELREAGSVSEEPFTEEDPLKPQPADEVELDGVLYVRADDGAENGEQHA